MGRRPLLLAVDAGGVAHFALFAVALPYWRISSALAGRDARAIALAYGSALLSIVWASAATAAFWSRLRQRVGAPAQMPRDVGAAVGPRALLELRQRQDETDATADRLLAERGTAAQRARRAAARLGGNLVIGLCVFAGLLSPVMALSALPEGTLQGTSYGVIAGAGIGSAATLATVLSYSAYHALRSLRETSSRRLIERLKG